MKKIIIFLLFLVSLNSNAQQITKLDSIPNFYLGIGTGWNSFSGIFGVIANLKLNENIYAKGALGICSWGAKYSIGLKYEPNIKGGLGYNASFSHYNGAKDVKITLDNNGDKQKVRMDLNSTNTIDLNLSYSWAFGKTKSKILYLDLGYSILLDSSPWKVVDGTELTEKSKDVIKILEPGGIIVGVGFIFGL